MASIFKRNGKGNWIIQYFDETGRRRERSSRTTDKRTATRIANEIGADIALRQAGIVDSEQARLIEEGRRPISEHVDAYLRFLRTAGRSPRTLEEKERVLAWLLLTTGATRLQGTSPAIPWVTAPAGGFGIAA